MAEFLLEVLSEELPFSAQKLAQQFLGLHVQHLLSKQRIDKRAEEIDVFTTPRRLVLFLKDLPDLQPSFTEEKKGPSIHASLTTLRAFLTAHHLASVDACDIAGDEKNPFYVVRKIHAGQPIGAILETIIPLALKAIPWKKPMRWEATGILWPRPLRAIAAVLDGMCLPLSFGPFTAGAVTQGHRFISPEVFPITSWAHYCTRLQAASVVLSPCERQKIISQKARELAQQQGLDFVHDDKLLEETAALVEKPFVYLGSIDPVFMSLPQEILVLTMRTHQKYFSLLNKDGTLAPHFIFVANIKPRDEQTMIRGYERVLRTRLLDATFLWEEDQKIPLSQWLEKLHGLIFHQKMGSMYEKVTRLVPLATALAPFFSLDTSLAEKTALLIKADLGTHMVAEFPELQGVIGAYLARHEQLGEDFALAMSEHYKPLGPFDTLPSSPLGQLMALVDKLDTLIQFFSIGEQPTSSKDPFALRRMALGVIRIFDQGSVQGDLLPYFPSSIHASLIPFFMERLKVYMLEQYAITRPLVAAVEETQRHFDIGLIVKNAKTLDHFLKTEDGKRFLNAYKRLLPILKQAKGSYLLGPLDETLFHKEAEQALWKNLQDKKNLISFEENLETLKNWPPLLEAFFDTVLVNDIHHATRQNRLRLLRYVHDALENVARFSHLFSEG